MIFFMEKTHNGAIIADTSGLFSLVVPSDHNHTMAIEEAKRLEEAHKDIIIIQAVYIEFLNVLGKQYGHEAALIAASTLTPPRFVIINEPHDVPSSGALEKFAEQPHAVSLTDCLVMATADAYATKS